MPATWSLTMTAIPFFIASTAAPQAVVALTSSSTERVEMLCT